MAAITTVDFVWMAILENMAIESILRQNWTNAALTPQEECLIRMAVSWTYGTLKEMAEEPIKHEVAHRS